MVDTFANTQNVRFFSDSSIIKKSQEELAKKLEDPTPFGLDFQEAFPKDKLPHANGVTFGSSITNLPTSSDCSVDLDYEW